MKSNLFFLTLIKIFFNPRKEPVSAAEFQIAEAPAVLQALFWRHHQVEESKQKIGSGLDLLKLRRRTETGFESEIGYNYLSKRS